MRAAFQIIVFPYKFKDRSIEVLIGQRSDDGFWQAISGGGEANETVLEAAIRELNEEASLKGSSWIQLDSLTMILRIYSKGHEGWHEHPYVISEYAFMTLAKGKAKRSSEHSELRWCSFNEAFALLYYDSNKTALWELSQRLNI